MMPLLKKIVKQRMVIFQRNSLALLTLNRRIAQYLLRRYTVGPLWALFKQSDSHSD